MPMRSSRRQFLFGGLKRVHRIKEIAIKQKATESEFILRPPGAIPERAFLRACNKECLQCLTACPIYAIQKVKDSLSPAYRTAYIDPTISGCSFCKDFPCIKACEYGALTTEVRPLGRAEVLASCITRQGEFCEICMTACPTDYRSMYKDQRGVLQIDQERCMGCGSCVSSCFLLPKAIAIYPMDRQI